MTKRSLVPTLTVFSNLNPNRDAQSPPIHRVLSHPQGDLSITSSAATMFFLYNMERRVTLHPSYFGRNMKELVTSKLVSDVEGTCAGDYYIIVIMDAFDISEGRVLPSTGLAEFTVGYRAVVWRPFKGETVSEARLHAASRLALLTRAVVLGRRHCCICESPGLLRERRPSETIRICACVSPPGMPLGYPPAGASAMNPLTQLLLVDP